MYEDDYAQNTDEYLANSGQFDEDGNRLVQNTDSNGRFHTDWLNMIFPRLKVAKDLLTDDGVIFISIDDNEVENLRKICDEVFGNQNFISALTIIVKTEGRRYRAFAKTHEYILVYAKNSNYTLLNEIEVSGLKYQYYDAYGGFNPKGLRNRNVQAFNSTNRPNLRYPFYADIQHPDDNGFYAVTPVATTEFEKVDAITINGLKSVWRWGYDRSQKQHDDLYGCRGIDGIIRIFQKERKLTQTPKTVWSEKEFISNKGTKEVKSLLGTGIFNFPKPVKLIKQLISIGTNTDSFILDFFSGSATTAHAVMQLNAEDGGHRKFIMVQLPEVCDEKSEAFKAGYKNICDIGEERIRRAGKKIKEDNPLTTKDLDIGFRVFNVDSTNMQDVYYTPGEYKQSDINLFADNIKEDRTPEDLLFQVMLDLGILLSSKIEVQTIGGQNVFSVADGYLLACFDEKITDSTITEIAKKKPYYAVFRDSSIENDSVAANFEQIFAAYSPSTVRKVL